MRIINLLQVSMEGFKSFRQPTTVRLGGPPGLKFLTGENQVDTELGANGAGKSSLWDAVFWCCYGTSTRGHRTSELLSWDSESASVECLWKIGNETRAIRRNGPPERVYIDNFQVEQRTVDSLLGLNKDCFSHSVLFAQAVPLFWDLSVPKRGEVLDEVLRTGRWLELSKKAGAKAREIEQQLYQHEKGIAFLRGKLEALSSREELEYKCAKWQAAQDTEKAAVLEDLDKFDDDLNYAKRTMHQLEHEVVDDRDARGELVQLQRELSDLDLAVARCADKVRGWQKDKVFYEKHDVCPTCQQKITQQFKRDTLEQLRQEIADAEAKQAALRLDQNTVSKKFLAAQEAHNELLQKQGAHKQKLEQARRDIRWIQTNLEACLLKADDLVNENNPYKAELERLDTVLRETSEALTEAESKAAATRSLLEMLEYWQRRFKEVRLFMIRNVVQRLNLETANAAGQLGIGHWQIVFDTQKETKSDTVKPGVFISCRSPEQSKNKEREWSPGELQRIKFAVALGLASLIQGMAGVWYGLEVFDEPSNYLSSKGIENLLEALRYRAEMQNKSVWLVDHRALVFSGFSEVWHAVKTSAGTTVSQE